MAKILKAAEGRTVDQEDGTPWPPEGLAAPDTLFVRRRLRDGDLVEVDDVQTAVIVDPPEPEPEPEPSPVIPEILPVAEVRPTKTKVKGGK